MKKIIGILLASLAFVVLLLTLSHYGINWDEPNHYIRGQAYLRYILSGKEDYKETPKLKSHYPKVFGRSLPLGITYQDDSLFRRSIYQYDGKNTQTLKWYLQNDYGHPPLNGILASLSNMVFYQNLGWLGDIEAYHLFIIFVVSVCLFFVFYFTSQHYGIFAGIISLLSMFFYPLLFSESHFNIKDPVVMSFYTLTIICFYYGITKNNWKLILATGLLAGLALGTKLNIVFSIFTIIPWLVICNWSQIKKIKWPLSKSLTISLLAMPLIALFILFVSWPFLWNNSWTHFLSFISYYKTIGGVSYQWNTPFYLFGLNTYAIQWISFITPLITLLLTFFGIISILACGLKERNKTSLLVLLWFLIPIIRVIFPNAGIYGGVRQIMEYIPAMAILSGIGAIYLVKLVSKVIHQVFCIRDSNKKDFIIYILYFILISSFIPIALRMASIHPNENVYFNPLMGGLRGAQERNFQDWGITLGSAYKKGVDWLNINAEKGARVALVRGLLSNIPRIMWREDIYFSEYHYSGHKKQGEYLIEVFDYRWNIDTPKEKREYIESLIPIYEEKIDGVSILKIWKNDIEYTKE